MKTYRNTETNEITESHKVAMGWFRAGAIVEICLDGERKLSWVH